MIKKALFYVFLCIACSVVRAEIIDLGSVTRDTSTGLDWLDLTETSNLSFNEIKSDLASGSAFSGWRFATSDEVNQLILDFGLPMSTWDNLSAGDSALPALGKLIQTLGDTAPAAIAAGSTFLSNTFVSGFVGISDDPGGAHFLAIAGISSNGDGVLRPQATALYSGDDDVSDYFLSSFLVRDASPVPLPASILFYSSALFGLLGLRISQENRRKRQNFKSE